MGRAVSREKSVDVKTTEMIPSPPGVFEMNALHSLKTRKMEIVKGRAVEYMGAADEFDGQDIHENTTSIRRPGPSSPSATSSNHKIPRKKLSSEVSLREVNGRPSDISLRSKVQSIPVTTSPSLRPSGQQQRRPMSKVASSDIAELDSENGHITKRFSDRSIMRKLSGRRSRAMLHSYQGSFVPHGDSVATIVNEAAVSPVEPKERIEQPAAQRRFATNMPAEQAGAPPKAQKEPTVTEVEAPSGYTSPDDMVPDEYDPFRPEYFGVVDYSRPLLSAQSTKVSSEANASSNITPLRSEDLHVDTGATQALSANAHGEGDTKAIGQPDKRRSGASEMSGKGSLTEGALRQVLDEPSSVAMHDRTNEWAQHLEAADVPEIDALQQISEDEKSPAIVKSNTTRADYGQERSAMQQKSREPLESRPSDQSRSDSTALNAPPRSVSNYSTRPGSPRESFEGARPLVYPKGPKRAPSASIPRSWSAAHEQLKLSTRGPRNSSMPLPGQQNTESPISEYGEDPSPPTLLAQRHNKIQNKYSSFSLTPSSSSPAAGGLQDAYSHSPSQLSLDDDDNMSLSQRRAIIHHQRQSDEYARPGSSSTYYHPSLQPLHRQSNIPRPEEREAMLANWRHSVRQDIALQTAPLEDVETKRAEMLMQKHVLRLRQEQEKSAKSHRNTSFDSAMRTRTDMQELHREAMRKMQATANRNA